MRHENETYGSREEALAASTDCHISNRRAPRDASGLPGGDLASGTRPGWKINLQCKKPKKPKLTHTLNYLIAHIHVLDTGVFFLLLFVSLVSVPVGCFSFLFCEEFQDASSKKLLWGSLGQFCWETISETRSAMDFSLAEWAPGLSTTFTVGLVLSATTGIRCNKNNLTISVLPQLRQDKIGEISGSK